MNKVQTNGEHRIWTFLMAISLIIGLACSCAEPSAPQGGPTDKRAPQFSKKKFSTPDKATNFQHQEIILTFDEWIKIQNAYSQVVISPPLDEKPEIKVRNKSIVVKWTEKLKDSTTYTINFGDAVRDITENNIVKNLKRVFSTGPYLDSLACTGQIIDAETRKPKSDVLVMLYTNLEDSMPLTQKPYYFSRTNEQGRFNIENIKAARYRIFALDDKNNDYQYNLANEEIGFLDSAFQVNDSVQPALRLLMFKEREETRVFGSKLFHYGCLVLDYNNKLQSSSTVKLLDAPADVNMYIEQGLDTLICWFDGNFSEADKWTFVVENEAENLSDTVRVTTENRTDFEENVSPLRWYIKRKEATSARGKGPVFVPRLLKDTTTILQSPVAPIELYFTRPIVAWDSSQFLLFKDTVLSLLDTIITETTDTATGKTSRKVSTERVLHDTLLLLPKPRVFQKENLKTRLYIDYPWQEKETYKLLVLPNGISDFFALTNKDSLSRIYTINPIDEYGSVSTKIINLDSSMQYVVQLVNAANEVIHEKVYRDSTQIQIDYKNLKTDNYTIRIIHDEVPNGRWDVGAYKTNRQPEKTTNSKPIALKAGWENFMLVDLLPLEIESMGKKSKGKKSEGEEENPVPEELDKDK